ncbi:MAG: alpha/beta hydrolase [Candidatus Dormiibacterota bacterium]
MPNELSTDHVLEVPGARLHYEVGGSGPLLALIGAPMDSSGFVALRRELVDSYTVVTYDPRGISRSTVADPSADAPPELLADDVHRLLAELTDEPVLLLGSSGGAITGLALATRYPEQVRTLLAHEPPLIELLPDRERLRVATDDIYATFQRDGQDAAMAKFLAMTGLYTPAPGSDDAPPPTAPDFEPTPRMRANTERFLAHMILPTTRYQPDLAALRATSTRIVVGGGAASTGQLARRTADALAAALGCQPVEFPGDHGGFGSHPEPFARVLREVFA